MHNPRKHITVGLTLIGPAWFGSGCAASTSTKMPVADVSPGGPGPTPARSAVGATQVVHVARHDGSPASSYGRHGTASTRNAGERLGCNPVRAMFTARAPGIAVLSASRTSCGEALRCGPQNGTYQVSVIVTG